MKEHFTPNVVIDNIEMNDSMIEIVGYIDNIKAKHLAANNNYIMRIVVNNGSDRRIQVVAWGKLIPKLEAVAEIENVIEIQGATSKYISPLSKFNDGNVTFQLNIKECTSINIIGKFASRTPKSNIIKKITFKDIIHSQGLIEIEGYVKNNFRLLKTKFQHIGLGSITDGENKLEVHIIEFAEDNCENIHKGHKVIIKGQLVARSNGPYYLRVNDFKDIQLLSKEKPAFEFLLHGVQPIE